MEKDSTKPSAGVAASALFVGENWFAPLEAAVRGRIRGFIEALLEEELAGVLARPRYARAEPGGDVGSGAPPAVVGHRHGHRERQLTGTFGSIKVRVPRARLATAPGGTIEWRNATLPAYHRRTHQAEALLPGAPLAAH